MPFPPPSGLTSANEVDSPRRLRTADVRSRREALSRRGLARCGAVLAALALSPAPAGANGRFPAAGYFVAGPGDRNDVFALRTTFGLLLSRDAGRSWRWVCEAAYNAVGASDPTVSIGADGTLSLASFSGLTVGQGDYCTWPAAPGVPVRDFADVSNTADGRTVVALAGPEGENALYLSPDGGRTWGPGARLTGYATETVDVAPGDRTRVYVTGYDGRGRPVLLRSDDGGRTVREGARDFLGGQNLFLGGVDPTNPDVVYLRALRGLATLLLRSDDGGATFRLIGQTAREMLGFALSDDGSTVWIASADRAEGILRSERGGPWIRMAANVGVKCLRYHAGVLFVCADEAVDGFALGYSHDGGDHVDPLLSLRTVDGPDTGCGPGTRVGEVCPALWSTETLLLRSIDASAPSAPVFHDASTDHGGVTDRLGVFDVVLAPLDAGRPFDAGVVTGDRGVSSDAATQPADATSRLAQPLSGCDCHAAGHGGPGRHRAYLAWLAAALALTRRRAKVDDVRSGP